MKILCCCGGGNWRSQHCALILKDVFHQDALAVGLATANGNDTREMLYEWADLIIVLTTEVIGNVPERYRSKTVLWDVGPDDYDHQPSLLLMRNILTHLDASGINFGPEVVGWAQTWRAVSV